MSSPQGSKTVDIETIDADETEDLTEIEQEDLNAAESDSQSVTYSGQDFDVNGLVRRLKKDDILVPSFGHDDERIGVAGFQRAFVWRRPQMDRFIESLLLGYPIPGIFLVRQADKRYLVLDGQQRLSTLRYFSDGVFAGREFALENVADRFKGLKYRDLPDDLRRMFDDTFIQATIVSSDGSKNSLESIYQIFERLNSGGTQLTPHEIRIALFAGPFVDFLEQLNRLPSWRGLYGRGSPRLRDQELVLRILALHMNAERYKRPLKRFLNEFVAEHRHCEGLQVDHLKTAFGMAAESIAAGVGADALRLRGRQVNAALAEVVFAGLMKRLTALGSPSSTAIREAVDAIKNDRRVQTALTRSTADEEQLTTRLGVAIEAFARA